MENTPVAPTPAAPAPEASVATPEPTNPVSDAQTIAPAPAPEISAEQVAKYLGTDTETFEKFNTFVKNNGQFEGAFKRMKDIISNPQQQTQPVTQPEALQAPQAPQTPQAPSQQPQAHQSAPQQLMDGTYSMEELMVAAQFEKYAQEPKYASIKDDIMGQKVLQGLKDFNINIVENGRFNDGGIRKYLDLYAATKPAKPTSTEPTNDTAMANDISNIKEITTMDEANRIQLDDIRRRNAGQPGNPLAEKAKEFVRQFYSNQMNKERRR